MGHKHSKQKDINQQAHNNNNNNSNSNNNNINNPSHSDRSEPPKFAAIRDKYETYEELQQALRMAGLESSNLIIGIDYTISNESAGRHTFGGKSLHYISPTREVVMNPYMYAITVIGRTLEAFDDDKLIPTYGFGDATTQDKSVFPFSDRVPYGFQEVLARYQEITPRVKMQGPTSFAPIIRQAIEIVRSQRAYHILVIIADGNVTPDNDFCQPTSETRNAIVEASNYPLSIIMVGVGDGPWDMMEEFDDGLPQRRFDNFQFVNFHSLIRMDQPITQAHEVNFAVSAMQEIPEQYQAIRKLGLLG